MANERARELRKTMTRQEVKPWVRLRELRALGFHFRRQSPIARYIVDFECRRTRVVVELMEISTASTSTAFVTKGGT